MASSSPGQNVALVLKTNEGGLWAIPQARELIARGHRVTFYLPKGRGRLIRELEKAGVPYRSLRFDFGYGNAAMAARGLRELRGLLKQDRVSVVFYHLYASAIAVRLCTLGMPVRRVHMVAGPVYLESKLIRFAESILVHLDAKLIAGSEFTFREYWKLPFAPIGKLTMVPYGIDCSSRLPAEPKTRSEARAKLSLRDNQFVVVMVAYFYPPKSGVGHQVGIKGHEFLLDAWAGFSAEVPQARLLLVGGGFGEAGDRYREQLRARYDNPTSVHWVDTVASVADYYHAADLSISPSISENHGAAMEASAYGVPSIVSAAGGLPEVVGEDGGWVIPTGDVNAIGDSLRIAFNEWQKQALSTRGAEARKRIERLYASDRLNRRIADIVVPAHSRTLTVVTEAHFRRSVEGNWVAEDGVNGDRQWTKYLKSNRQLQVVGRSTSQIVRQEAGDPVTVAEVVPLPDGRGLSGFLKKAPHTAVRMLRAVSESQMVVLRMPGPVTTLAGVLAVLKKKPYAVELVGDIAAFMEGQRGVAKVLSAPLKALTKLLVARAAAVRYVTESSLQRTYPARTDLQIGISNVDIDAELIVNRSRTGVSSRRGPVFLAVGTQQANYKGHQFAIEAMPALLRKYPEAELVLVGDGAYQSVLRDLAKSMGLSDRVRFAGKLGRDEVIKWMDIADVLLQPSITEGLPRTIIEAGARGLPSIGSNVAGIPELIPAGQRFAVGDVAGLIDVLTVLVDDDCRYAEASAACLDMSKRYARPILDQRFAKWFEWLESL